MNSYGYSEGSNYSCLESRSEKESINDGGESSIKVLQPHPFNLIIKEF